MNSPEPRRPFNAIAFATVATVSVAAFLIGFYILPAAQNRSLESLWQTICRAAGVVSAGRYPDNLESVGLSAVVVPAALRTMGSSEQIGEGATLALRCTMCHGAAGLSEANSPNLAGQYADVVYKQLLDYRQGARANVVMTALARTLSEEQIAALAHYYAYLPKSGGRGDLALAPRLVRVGDPLRNIGPCASCHGNSDRKNNTPWINGAPEPYLERQLLEFESDARRNDINSIMRNVAHQMSSAEIASIARYYADPAN